MTSSPSKSASVDKTTALGRLLAILTAAFYGLFTLLPNSKSLMVVWPWVFIWQMALLTPMLWLLWQVGLGRRFHGLGKRWDAIAVLGIVGLLVANLGAEFPNQAHWYGWAALGVLAGLYALHHWLWNPQEPALIEARRDSLLVKQGYLSFAFIILSLLLWTTQTLIPYLTQSQKFKELGVNLSFSFSNLELRNWAPIGHQNYVAGYLILALPLFFLLTISSTGKQRLLWLMASVLGLVNLYTTSSRGGLIALGGLILWGLVGIAIHGKLNRRWLIIIATSITTVIGIFLITNDRFKTDLSQILQGLGSAELSYRFLNAVIAWRMGSNHPWTGVGLGGVPLLYQKYRPFWAGRDSELIYQLHSTPSQLFAEMGIWGLMILTVLTLVLIYSLGQWLKNYNSSLQHFVVVWSISGALFTYGIMSITDYQLDNLSISGLLVIYWVILISYFSESNQVITPDAPPQKVALPLTYGGLALILVVSIWLFPIQRAWQLSNLGFSALTAKKLPAFVNYLTQANQLAPWEAYYPFQLGWNLGDLALAAPDQISQKQLNQTAIAWFQKGIKVSPYQEFAYNNVGWLQLGTDPVKASQDFAKALTLVPAKRGVFYALGISLLAQKKIDLAIQAFSLECLRDPLFITSPFWRGPLLKNFAPQVFTEVGMRLNELIKKAESQTPKNMALISLLHQIRGGLFWWQGNFPQAEKDISQYGTPVSQGLMAISQGKSADLKTLSQFANQIITAWNHPSERSQRFQQAWIEATQTPLPAELEQQLILSMQASSNLHQWLTQMSPVLQYRRERLGFGVVSRHIDGPNPKDFFLVVDNLPMTLWFNELFPSPFYDSEFDRILQPEREKLLQQVLEK